MQREVLGFRTPQHPSLGTNHWGGASPMLARNVPKESLDQRYEQLNTIRKRDEIFQSLDHEYYRSINMSACGEGAKCDGSCPTPRRRGLLFELIWPRKNDGSSKKKRWFRKWDAKKKWPQGWC